MDMTLNKEQVVVLIVGLIFGAFLTFKVLDWNDKYQISKYTQVQHQQTEEEIQKESRMIYGAKE